MSNQSSQERISQKLSSVPGGKGRSSISLFVMITVVAVVVIVTVVFLANPQETTKQRRDTVVTPENVEELIAERHEQEEERVAPGYYETKMNTTWHFNSTTVASYDAYVENSTANSNAVYFDVKLSETGEIIYSSPIIPVGSHLEDITLDTELAAGTYDCILTYYLLDEEEEPISKLNIRIAIVVEN